MTLFNYHLKIKKALTILGLFIVILLFFGAYPARINIAQAQEDSYNFREDSGLSITGEQAGYDKALTPEPEIIVGQVVQAILSVLGIIFLAFMIYAGITWITAQGDSQKSMKAKRIIEGAITGLIIVIAAYTISYFIINYFAAQKVIAN